MPGFIRAKTHHPRKAALAIAAAAAMAFTMITPIPAQGADVAPYRATVFEHGYDSTKLATLSFDGDWSAAGVPSILQTLQANNIIAAFGLTGRFADTYPTETKSIAAAGHKIVNHSYSHPYFSQLTQAQRWSELDRAEAAYRRLGLTSAGWFRAPYRDAYTDPGLNRDLALRGYYINFDWTFDTTGYNGASLAVILDRIHRYMVPGGIVVMHVGAGSTDPQYLTQIIAELKSMGYSFTNPYRALTWGSIRAKWTSLGAQNSAFGAPRTPEMIATTTGTTVQWYQKGRFYWRSGYPTFYVFGGILTKYIALGTVTGPGFPVTDEIATPGGRVSKFQHGHIYWSSATSAHFVLGGILSRYLSLGGTGGRLGFPVTDEYSITGGRRSTFQHGYITWNATTGATTVVYT